MSQNDHKGSRPSRERCPDFDDQNVIAVKTDELFLFMSRESLTYFIKAVLHTDDGPDFYHQR